MPPLTVVAQHDSPTDGSEHLVIWIQTCHPLGCTQDRFCPESIHLYSYLGI